jgi:hypothetical protein
MSYERLDAEVAEAKLFVGAISGASHRDACTLVNAGCQFIDGLAVFHVHLISF